MRVLEWLDGVRQDLVFAGRRLRTTPLASALVAGTLALGVGVNAALFALVDAALLRPLPYPAADRLVMIAERTQTTPRAGVSPLDLVDWRARSRSFDALAGFVPSVGGMVMAGRDGTSETVPRQWVTAGIFDVLGLRPIVGRTFTERDDATQARVAVLSEAFWRTRFGSDTGVVGRRIAFDGEPYEIVGIAPDAVQLGGRASMWALQPIAGAPPQARRAYIFRVIGRLAASATLDSARADLEAVAAQLAREYPETNAGRSTTVIRLRDGVVGDDAQTTAALFLAVVALVLLLCCANVASLLAAVTTSRTRELAIRAAVGASRWRVLRHLVVHSLLLAVLGGALGLAAAAAVLAVIPGLVPPGLLPDAVTLAFDGRVAAFAAASALLAGLVAGAAPAWQAAGGQHLEGLGVEARTVAGGRGRLRHLLVGVEVAGATVLLVGAALLLRTLIAVTEADRGYRAGNVLSLMVDPLGSRYPTAAALLQFFDAIEREVLPQPGVAAVAWSSALPMDPDGGSRVSLEVVGDPVVDPGHRPAAGYESVSPSYFGAIGLPIVAGRGFDARDVTSAPPVVMVDEAVARHLGGRRQVVGLRLALRPDDAPQAEPVVREVVGVVRHVAARPDEIDPGMQLYVPLAQRPLDDVYLLVQPKTGPASALIPATRAAIARVDKEQLVSVRDLRTLGDLDRRATARHRFRALLVGAFSALALGLASAGVFGLLSNVVQGRRREIAVRRALGASAADVAWIVGADAVRALAVGIVAGLAASIWLGRLMSTVLFGVAPFDGVAQGAAVLAVALSAAAAVIAPLSRALRVDPARELRSA
ncbi:MAG: ADOP family duplicated permease [Vicinamibacterales bacterium]